MGTRKACSSAVLLVILAAACESPAAPGDHAGSPSFASSSKSDGKQIVMHVDAKAPSGGNGSGGSPFNNLPDAIAAARVASGPVKIQVEPGDYTVPHLVIDFPVELRGSTEQVPSDDPWPTGEVVEGTATRIIAPHPLGSDSLFDVGRADAGVLTGVRISGFVFQGSATGIDVLLTRVQDFWIANNVFRAPATFGMQSIASSGRVSGNHFSGVGTGAVLTGGYPESPSTVLVDGNRAIGGIQGGVLLTGASFGIPELGDYLDAVVRDNDLSNNTGNPMQGFGLRLFILRRDLGAPGSSQSSATVHALAQGNRMNGNQFGITLDAGFPYRQVGPVCDTRVYSGEIELELKGNTATGSLRAPGLISFTRSTTSLNPAQLPQNQYLHGATFTISDRDGTLANVLIDHPSADPYLGPCPADGAHELLSNTLLYNGALVLNQRNF